MTNNITVSVIILLVMTLTLGVESIEYSSMRRNAGEVEVTSPLDRCDGLLGEDCLNIKEEEGNEEGYEDTEEAKTIRYISYGALQRDNVPCDRRGNSYYSCGTSGQVNPYHRGCSVITYCARDG
ncbi:rapid alkalinization factor-like [Pyrus ussuriensis x Pyrus communis]|uniref:Rapid alkalinization factor-like n=2 Tax=Pyrus TaxID=3766 RepID=A0A5N5FFM5_9ROSA|nr:rapid alkalinization factor-like [Pyrus ussuriensis x Pyrus communis]